MLSRDELMQSHPYVRGHEAALYAFAVGCSSAGGTCAPSWIATSGADQIVSSPAVSDGVVYVGVAYPCCGPPGPAGSGGVRAFDLVGEAPAINAPPDISALNLHRTSADPSSR